jgi:hypothetical protein
VVGYFSELQIKTVIVHFITDLLLTKRLVGRLEEENARIPLLTFPLWVPTFRINF